MLLRLRSGFTALELIVVLVVLAGLIAAFLMYEHDRQEWQATQFALNLPGIAYDVECWPNLNVYEKGERVIMNCLVTNKGAGPDFVWADKAFMLSIVDTSDEDPGYPVPPETVELKAASGVRQDGRTPSDPIARQTPTPLPRGSSILLQFDVGPAQGAGFKGKILIDQGIGGLPKNNYDLRDPSIERLIDWRYLLSHLVEYEVRLADRETESGLGK